MSPELDPPEVDPAISPAPEPVESTPPPDPTPAPEPITAEPPKEPSAVIEPPKPVIPPKIFERIDQLTRINAEKDAELASLRARLQPEQVPEGTPQPTTQAEIRAQVNKAAAEMLFNQECNKIYAQGEKDFPDFKSSVEMIQRFAGQSVVPIIETAMELGEPHKVLYELGRNPEEVARISSLPVARQAAALAKFSLNLSNKPPVSKAPAPIPTPAGGGASRGAPSLYDEDLPVSEWMKLREKELKAKAH